MSQVASGTVRMVNQSIKRVMASDCPIPKRDNPLNLGDKQDLKTTKEGGFRFNCKQGMFTYRGHLPKDELRTLFEGLTKKSANYLVQFAAAHEVGQSTGIDYEHTHVLVCFAKALDVKHKNGETDLHQFDFDNGEEMIHPHIKRIVGEQYWRNAVLYISKEDLTVCEDKDLMRCTMSGGQKLAALAEAKTLIEANQALHGNDSVSISNIAHTQRVYLASRMADVHYHEPCPDLEYKWQEEILESTKGVSEKIVFYIIQGEYKEAQVLTRYLWINDRPNWTIHSNIPNPNTCFNASFKAYKSGGWNGRNWAGHLRKSKSQISNVLESLLSIKSGYLQNGAVGGVLPQEVSNVIVFLDHYVDIPSEYHDRVEVREVTAEGEINKLILDDSPESAGEKLKYCDRNIESLKRKLEELEEMREQIIYNLGRRESKKEEPVVTLRNKLEPKSDLDWFGHFANI